MGEAAKNTEIAELVSRVRNGDEAAFSILLSKYSPLIENSLTKVLDRELYGVYADDLRQEATMVFYNSILTYDMEQYEVEFGLYAKICITNALISQRRLLIKRSGEKFSENAIDELLGNDAEDPSALIMEQESLRSLYSVIRSSLSELEHRIWRLYMSGMTAGEIGAAVGKSNKAVNNAIYRIRKKLRQTLQ